MGNPILSYGWRRPERRRHPFVRNSGPSRRKRAETTNQPPTTLDMDIKAMLAHNVRGASQSFDGTARSQSKSEKTARRRNDVQNPEQRRRKSCTRARRKSCNNRYQWPLSAVVECSGTALNICVYITQRHTDARPRRWRVVHDQY